MQKFFFTILLLCSLLLPTSASGEVPEGHDPDLYVLINCLRYDRLKISRLTGDFDRHKIYTRWLCRNNKSRQADKLAEQFSLRVWSDPFFNEMLHCSRKANGLAPIQVYPELKQYISRKHRQACQSDQANIAD